MQSMISYIRADDQRKIRSELEEVQRIMQTVFSRLNPLERSDERVTRTEAALAAVERVLWTMTSGPGRLGPKFPVHAILKVPAAIRSVAKGAQSA
jgi:hypothetical protein